MQLPAGDGHLDRCCPGGGTTVFAQDQRAFPILKALEQQKLSEAIQLVRASQRCVEEATNLYALQDCHRQERQREWEQRERFHRQIELVRARYGLRRPGGERGGDRGGGPHRLAPVVVGEWVPAA